MAVPDALTRKPAAADVFALEALEKTADEVGAASLAEDARQVAARVAAGLFYLVCVGEFKRGKSTLLNAFVGREVLPAGVVPVTSAVTILRYGTAPRARVRLRGGAARCIALAGIPDYVTEERNPENRKGVAAVEVFLPSPLLADGMCLVDTPGIGSVFEGNSAATRDFLPHVDAALVVLGADPPISGDELALVASVAGRIEHLIFVLNKADRLPDVESAEAAGFAERILSERLKRPVSLLSVSASERLVGEGPVRDWEILVRSLEALTREAGAELVRSAADRGARRLSRLLLREIEEQREALLRPLEESERRLTELRKTLAEAERALSDLGALLAAEEDRLAARLDEDREAFLARLVPVALEELRRTLSASRASRDLRGDALEAARSVARKILESWGEAERPAVESLYREGADHFVALGNRFLARFLGTDEPELVRPGMALARETGFRVRSRFHFTELRSVAGAGPYLRLFDRLRSRESLRAATARDAETYLERLLSSNSARVGNDLKDLVHESRGRLEAEIRGRLSAAVTRALKALELARARQAEGAASVGTAIARLDALRRRVDAAGPPV